MRSVLALLVMLAPSAAATSLTASDAKLLHSLVATEVGRDPRVDLLTSTDVKKALDVEAARSFSGCDESSDSCMAEIAAAMNASQVLHGTLGVLGDDVVLSLSLFDSASATAVGRVTAKGKDAGAVGDQIDDDVRELLAKLPAGARTRVLLLDFDAAATAVADPSATSTSSSGPPLLLLVGGGTAGVGLLALGAAGVIEVLAAGAADVVDDDTKADDARTTASGDLEFYTSMGRLAWIGGGVLVVGGAALAAVPLVAGE
jgi:hypothetical protein